MFQRILGVGSELNGAVGGVGAHIGELFLLTNVDIKVFFFVAEADDHTLVNGDAGRDEESAAGLGSVQGVGGGGASFKGDEGAVALGVIAAGDGLVAVGERGHNGGAAGGGEELVAEADEGSGGDLVDEAGAAGGGELLGDESGTAETEFLGDSADKLGGNLNSQFFHGFLFNAINFAVNDFGAAGF